MADRHDWNSWDNYLSVHDSWLATYDYLIVEDQLRFLFSEHQVYWNGVLYCDEGIEIHVTKSQEVEYRSGKPFVKTAEYSYHGLWRAGERVINLVRYDNIHQHKNHPTRHHRHRFDSAGEPLEPTDHVGEEGWPTLGDFVIEVFQMWEERKAQEQQERP